MKLLKKLCCLCCIFTLCTTFLSNAVFADKALNIVFVGGVCTGKTSLRARAVGDPYNFLQCRCTRYTNVFNTNLRYQNEDLRCYLYDTSGNPRVREEIIKQRLDCADIVVVTMDASRADYTREFKENVEGWLAEIRKFWSELPILMVVTKADAASDMRPLIEGLQKFKMEFSQINFDYVAVSALEGTNLGNMKSQDDFGDNFWGKIRCIVRDRGMLARLKEDEGPITIGPDGLFVW